MNSTKNEMILGFAGQDLNQLKKYAEEISGQWNLDESGISEDKAHCAEDVIQKIDELQVLLDELEN